MTTLPFDFDIFLRSGSRIQPEIAALRPRQARRARGAARTTVENSQVRMISWRLRAQVHREDAREQVGVVAPSRAAICGVSDDVAQVSMTSGSPMKPPGSPRWSSV